MTFRHGSEPAVRLKYSDKSTSGATISLGVADEVTRDSFLAGPSGHQSKAPDAETAGPSNSEARRETHDSSQDGEFTIILFV